MESPPMSPGDDGFDPVSRLDSMIRLLNSLSEQRFESQATVDSSRTRDGRVAYDEGQASPRLHSTDYYHQRVLCSDKESSQCLHIPGDHFCKVRPALFRYCRTGDTARFDRALRIYSETRGRSISFADDDLLNSEFEGRTMMGLAAEGGHLIIVETLLALGACPDIEDAEGDLPIHLALRHSEWAVFEALLSPETSGALDHTALINASTMGRADCVRTLLTSKRRRVFSVNQQDSNGTSALLAASIHGRHQVARVLIDAGAHVDDWSPAGTALTVAAARRDLEMVSLLLEAGADIHLALLCMNPDINSGAQRHCSQKRAAEVIKQCWRDCISARRFRKQRLRRVFISQYRCMMDHQNTKQLILDGSLSESISDRSYAWSFGVNTLKELLAGSLPTSATHILSALLVALSIASFMDDDTFCLDDNTSHWQSVVNEVPEWTRLMSDEATRTACEDLAADLWGSKPRYSVDGINGSIPEINFWPNRSNLDVYIDRLTAELELVESSKAGETGSLSSTRETMHTFILSQEDLAPSSSPSSILTDTVNEESFSSFDDFLLDINMDPYYDTRGETFSNASWVNTPSHEDLTAVHPPKLASGVICVLFILFLALFFMNPVGFNELSWSAQYKALCKPTMDAAIHHMQLEVAASPIQPISTIIPEGHDIASADIVLDRRHIWNLEILYDNISVLGHLRPIDKHVRSFCQKWKDGYLLRLKQHVWKFINESPEHDSIETWTRSSSEDTSHHSTGFGHETSTSLSTPELTLCHAIGPMEPLTPNGADMETRSQTG
ncbi:hypothetical protein PFICI_12483 [Pestalotiopsis fici W106-1]|uniref:Uncharacterized protein n=1 Tax=Pestalotiopsis fici (strain W106-1 / CGMCC3.15140) TaxID=1229662 RepID=W3WP13_PESFW|nr:uncharacterized protein PFICI_12483 [Pestalotiopsis fici W106-1]ETS75539.1 hypothetical protein PFICI_12483 [Pestalotiopsis fici W106-1]